MSWRRNSLRRSKSCLPDFVPLDESPRRERLRIARDLHDTFAQSLAGLGYSLDSVIANQEVSARSKRELRAIRLDLSGLLQELRDEILALRQEVDAENSQSAIEEWLRARLPIGIDWIHGGFDYEAIPSSGELSHLLLELINNAAKHQGITHVEILEFADSINVRFLSSGGSLFKINTPHVEANLPKLGRIGILERVMKLEAGLEERESGFTLRWQS